MDQIIAPPVEPRVICRWIPLKLETSNLQPALFKVNIENLRVRDQPGTKGKELLRLPAGHEITALGEISDFTTGISLRGVNYEEPWLKSQDKFRPGWMGLCGRASVEP